MAFANKRGQEGITLTTILLLVLGVVVVILVILFATGFFDKLGGATDNLPGNLQAAVSACQVAAQSDLTADYCRTFRGIDVNGKTQYQVCDSDVIENNFAVEAKKLNCASPVGDADIKAFCESQRLKADTTVGTRTCAQVGATLS
jgi:hypothetical protein